MIWHFCSISPAFSLGLSHLAHDTQPASLFKLKHDYKVWFIEAETVTTFICWEITTSASWQLQGLKQEHMSWERKVLFSQFLSISTRRQCLSSPHHWPYKPSPLWFWLHGWWCYFTLKNKNLTILPFKSEHCSIWEDAQRLQTQQHKLWSCPLVSCAF